MHARERFIFQILNLLCFDNVYWYRFFQSHEVISAQSGPSGCYEVMYCVGAPNLEAEIETLCHGIKTLNKSVVLNKCVFVLSIMLDQAL